MSDTLPPELESGIALTDERMALAPRGENEALSLKAAHSRWQFLYGGNAQHGQVTGAELVDTLSTVIDTVPAGLVLADAQTRRFVFANTWFCNMLGYSNDEIMGMSPLDIHPAEVLPRIEETFQRMAAGHQKIALGIPVLRKDGSTIIVDIERLPVALSGRTDVLAVFTDITERHQTEAALKASESHLHTLVKNIPGMVWLKDVNGVFLSCNPAMEHFCGAPQSAIVGKTDFDFFPLDMAESFRSHDRAAMAAQGPMVNEEWISNPDNGKRTLMRTTKVSMRGSDGQFMGVLGFCRDITEQRATEDALEAKRERLQTAIDAAQAGTWEWDIAEDVVRYDERAGTMFGYKNQQNQHARENHYDQFTGRIHPEDLPRQQSAMRRHLQGELPSFELELRMRHKEGQWVWIRTLGRIMQRSADGKPLLVAGINIDINEQKTHRERIDYITLHDALTGLPNRKLFVDELARAMGCLSPKHYLAVAYIDLDNLASINLAHGLEVGSQLILEVSRRISNTLQGGQLLGHIGGDEFAVAWTCLTHPDNYVGSIRNLLDVMSEPIKLMSLEISVTASAGVALFGHADNLDAEKLLRQADQAMYLAKQSGKNRCYRFDTAKDEMNRDRLKRIDELQRALHNNEMVLHYQPKVRLNTGEVIGFEALIRWQHPTNGLLLPYAFIDLLEQHPVAIALGDWVINAALSQLAQWRTQGLDTCVSVNVDAMQLLDPDFFDRLQAQMGQQPSVLPGQLELEILETGAMGNMEQVSALIRKLQAIGLECALDDFGTGYSSLTFLKQLAAHTLKIDQSFVRGMLDDAEHATIVKSVLGLARNFDRRVVAEGVETEAQGTRLIELGCEFGQGYAISRPMPATRVPDWLAQWHAPPRWLSAREFCPLLAAAR